MSILFKAMPYLDNDLLMQVSCTTPHTPFNHPAYAKATLTQNTIPYALALVDGSDILTGCLAILTNSGWKTKLEIPTAPSLPAPEIFWQGVIRFCQQHDVCELDVQTFAAVNPDFPELHHEVRRRDRFEYVIDLTIDFAAKFSKNHQRNIRKAKSEGMIVERTQNVDACETHLSLMRASLVRRRSRGETVEVPTDQTLHNAFLKNDIGELFQVRCDTQTVGSVLILRNSSTAYYHSAGTLPLGMRHGASQYLIGEVANTLKADGLCQLNLGGIDPEADGLRRFKRGFGAREIPLEAATYSLMTNSDEILHIFRNTFDKVRRKIKSWSI